MRSIVGILTLSFLLTSCGGSSSPADTLPVANENLPDNQTQQKNWSDSKWDNLTWQ